ncbi:MAG: GNAT family N-acetyltransferase [Tepidiformaceae bacterium]
MPFIEPSIRLLERVSNFRTRSDGVSVRWFERWTPECEAAHAELGGGDWLPSALLREMLADQSVHPKRVALVEQDRRPWALVPLRLGGAFWEPLTQGVVHGYPHLLCSEKPELVISHLRLNVAFWDAVDPPDGWRGVRWSASAPAYEIPLDPDPERHWRSTDLWKSIIQANRRTAAFELVCDDFDATQWTIERWRDRFYRGNPADVSSKWGDRIVAARWGLNAGTVHSWVLRDGGRFLAGVVAAVRDAKLTFETVYRDPDYDWYSVGSRTFYEAFRWAQAAGLDAVSLGSLHRYKRRWAPLAAPHWNFVVAPFPVHVLQGSIERARQLLPGHKVLPEA